jgi:antitoxin (DNA-binding transcriptional repressor) of toxin-antitoxin stability system
MTSITLAEAQSKLRDLIHGLTLGEEVVITENDRAVAKLVPAPREPSAEPRVLGTLRGSVLSMDHFDDPLEDFEEYTR